MSNSSVSCVNASWLTMFKNKVIEYPPKGGLDKQMLFVVEISHVPLINPSLSSHYVSFGTKYQLEIAYL